MKALLSAGGPPALSACCPSWAFLPLRPVAAVAAPPKPVRLWRPPVVGSPPLPGPFSLALGLCAARPWLLVPALVRLSALSLPALSPLPLLVRLLAARCVWLWLPGLPLSALGSAWLWLLLLLSLRPVSPWPRPLLVPLVLLVLFLPRRPRAAPLPLARCASLRPARGGPLLLPAGVAVVMGARDPGSSMVPLLGHVSKALSPTGLPGVPLALLGPVIHSVPLPLPPRSRRYSIPNASHYKGTP